ncbi:MFS transporter [Thauera aromatica]|uniref:MFS transporter n=1 Tax=Thauera aromatica TaxID=59405 RepID=UPI001FFDC4FA|nr:MFS transporter [Thauera aromatica]MCK2088838.1 MFS transporter [Thauera aromatica]
MTDGGKLWTPGFIALNLQFMLVTCVTALFFPFHAYLGLLGLSQESAGLIIGADALASLIVQPLVALLIHPATARRWLIGGSLVFAAALYMASHATGFVPLMAARLLQGAGFSCVIAALICMIVETIPAGKSGQAFGWASLVRLVPYALMPPLLDVLGILPAAFGQVLQWAALIALLPIALALFSRQGNTAAAVAAPPGMAGALDSVRSLPIALLLFASLALYGGYAAVFFFLRELGNTLGIVNSGLFFTLATVVMMLARLFGGPYFDRHDKLRLSTAGFCLVAACYVLLPFASQQILFFALAVFLGLGWGVIMPLQAALMFDVSPPAMRGLNQNLLLAMMQAGFFLGPSVAGVLLSATGFTGLFAAAALTTLCAALANAALNQRSA